jgi:Domain of unknown function (DUF4168)
MKLPTSLAFSLICCLAAPVAIQANAQASPHQNFGIFDKPITTAPNLVALYEGVSNAELRKYASVIIETEPLRLEALNTIQRQIGGGQVPDLMCSEPSSMDGLPASARRVFVKYCNSVSSSAQKHGLSQSSFNRITSLVSSDSRVRERLQRQVSCIQSGSC